jgi:4-hydroxybenzoyl-CoA thioesterase
MRSFRAERRIRFSDCDPAGIVFYPQYFVLFNGVMEDWVDALGVGFADLVTRRRIGLPSVRIEADFQAVSRVGDAVHLLLEVERLGSRSLTLDWRCVAARDGESACACGRSSSPPRSRRTAPSPSPRTCAPPSKATGCPCRATPEGFPAACQSGKPALELFNPKQMIIHLTVATAGRSVP